MIRLLRAGGYAVAAAVLLRLLLGGGTWAPPMVPVLAALSVGVAYGLERRAAPEGTSARWWAATGVAFAAVGLSLAVFGWPGLDGFSFACWVAAATLAPVIGAAMDAFAHGRLRDHTIAGALFALAVVPAFVHLLPAWTHPITHWSPFYWVHLSYLQVFFDPATLDAMDVHRPATWAWEYPAVPIFEAALYTWLLDRRVRRLRAQAVQESGVVEEASA